MNRLVIASLIFLVSSAGAFFGAWWTAKDFAHKVVAWEKAPGVVTGERPNQLLSSSQDGTFFEDLITFQHDGKDYTIGSGSKDLVPQEPVTVMFPPGHPEQAIYDGNGLWVFPVVLFIFAIVFLGIGIITLRKQMQRMAIRRELLERGKKLSLPVAEVQMDPMVVADKHPYKVVCHALDSTGKVQHIFTSDFVWFDPKEQLRNYKTVDVYVDPDNAERYYVDISFLKK